MTFVYRISIYIYHFLIWIAAPFNNKARLYHRGRRGWKLKLQRQIDPDSRYIWIHCASLGEFEQGRPLIESIREDYREYKILLTFFSPSGYEIRKKYPFADVISYLPADTPGNARRFLDITRPEKVLFVKYEFWNFYIRELKRRSVPVFLVSGIFRPGQVFFSGMPWSKWFREILNGFTHFFVQDQESARLLEKAGLRKYTISGDTRFDRVAAIAKSAKDIPVVEKFSAGKTVLIAGSTWKPDEEVISRFINENDHIKCIIAPHEVTPENINKLERLLKKPSVRLSLAEEKDVQNYQVLIVDSIGLLSSLYRYGKMAYIGGGFGVGIHNILEAATFGLPVIFGPNYHKFREARELVALNGAIPVTSYQELREILSDWMQNSDLLEEKSVISYNYVKNNRGATKIILNKIF